MPQNKTIRVEIPYDKFWQMALGHDIHMNISVFKTLRAAGIPVDGGLDMRGVAHGRLTMFNIKSPKGERVCVYEWTPGPDSVEDDDEEL